MMVFGNPVRALARLLTIGMATGLLAGSAWADDDGVPAELAPFTSLVGGWKGTGQPVANRIKGWHERHVWAWKFAHGKPVAVTLNWEGDKLLTAGTITADPESGGYKLEGKDGDGKAVVYTGKFDETGRHLVLRPTTEVDGDPQVTIRVHENGIRYTVWIDRKENGAPRARREIEVGVTKDGEAFAAGGGSASNGPKCVVTGGTATLSVSYQGKTYPLCCTGCRDEFNENPAKYVAKAAAMARGGDASPANPPSRSTPEPEKEDGPETKKPDPTPNPASPRTAGKSTTASRSASWLRLGQALEKSGKKSSALEYYKRIINEAADSPEASAAAARIKALEGK